MSSACCSSSTIESPRAPKVPDYGLAKPKENSRISRNKRRVPPPYYGRAQPKDDSRIPRSKRRVPPRVRQIEFRDFSKREARTSAGLWARETKMGKHKRVKRPLKAPSPGFADAIPSPTKPPPLLLLLQLKLRRPSRRSPTITPLYKNLWGKGAATPAEPVAGAEWGKPRGGRTRGMHSKYS